MKATPKQIRAYKIHPKQMKLLRGAGFEVTDFMNPRLKAVQWKRGDIYLVFDTRKAVSLNEFTDRLIRKVYYKTNRAMRGAITFPDPTTICFPFSNKLVKTTS